MLSYVDTSLFDSPAQTLVNTVNTVGVMGKGVAAQFKRRYPDMFRRYRDYCRDGTIDIGKLYLYRTPNRWVLNFPTKRDWRKPSRLEYIQAGLEKFVATYTRQGITSISFPQLGCGNGNLPWAEVRPLIEAFLSSLPIPVYVHVAPRQERFIAEHLTPAARSANLLARQSIGFRTFMSDLFALLGGAPGEIAAILDSEAEVVPLRLEPEAAAVELSLDALADLWNSLRLKGSIETAKFPAALQEHQEKLATVLLGLRYVKPIRFVRPDGNRAGGTEGLRFAPPPALPDPLEEREVLATR